jgi:hypothetical protein
MEQEVLLVLPQRQAQLAAAYELGAWWPWLVCATVMQNAACESDTAACAVQT